ncbi:MAG: hypothetical protein ACJAQ6_000219 [Arenicella sp.]|jgi:hypothetical protein
MLISRHAILAYLLLSVILGLLLKLMVMPLTEHFQRQFQATEKLQEELLAVQSLSAETEQERAAIKSQIEVMVKAGTLAYASNRSEAGHRLQQLLKSSLKKQSVVISRLRPINETLLDGLSKSTLELSFQAPSESLQAILSSLSDIRPKLDIELISLRNNERVSTKTQGRLEVSLSVATWYTSDAAFTNISASTGNEIIVDSEELELQPEELELQPEELELQPEELELQPEELELQPNVLAGLFDQATRSRLRLPSLKHYRLAAINISRSARIAIIANSGDGKIRRLESGDRLDAWRVESIDSNGVSLQIGDRQEILKLKR